MIQSGAPRHVHHYSLKQPQISFHYWYFLMRTINPSSDFLCIAKMELQKLVRTSMMILNADSEIQLWIRFQVCKEDEINGIL